jgi:hypothetical protein
MDRKESLTLSVSFHHGARRVFDWWVSGTRWDLDHRYWYAGGRIGTWQDVRDDGSRRVSGFWSEPNHREFSMERSDDWDPDELLIVTKIHQEGRRDDGGVEVIDRCTITSFVPSANCQTDVHIATEWIFTGAWRRRDFLPGSVGRRRTAYRFVIRSMVGECEKALGKTHLSSLDIGCQSELAGRSRSSKRETTTDPCSKASAFVGAPASSGNVGTFGCGGWSGIAPGGHAVWAGKV